MQKLAISTLFERVMLVLTGLILLMIVINVTLYPHFLHPDVSMYTEMGQKLLDGQRPYVDYEEINFPMIHALNVLPASLSRLTGFAPTVTVQICLVALLLLSLGMTGRLLTAYSESRSVAFTVIFGMTALSWVLFIVLQWGEREHIFVLLYLPWMVTRLMRREDKPIGRGTALTVGLMAGIGVALKPYFVLTAILVEGVGLLTTRRWCVRTPEVIGVLAVAGLHGAYFALNPDALQGFILLIQRLSAGYGAYSATPWSEQIPFLLINLSLGVTPFILFTLRYRYRVLQQPLLLALGAMALGSLFSFLLQQKGWNYHALPMILTNSLIVLLLGIEAFLGYVRPPEIHRQTAVKSRMMTAAFGLIIGIIAFELVGIRALMRVVEGYQLFTLNPYVETYTQPGDRVMFVNTDLNPAYPMLAALNRRSASRYATVQAFPIAYYRYQGLPYSAPNHVVPAYMQEYLDAFAEDMATYNPKLVIFRSDKCGSCSGDFSNMYDYLVARGTIDAVITPGYTLLTVADGFHLYVRNDLAPKP